MNWLTRWWLQQRLLRELDAIEVELSKAASHARRIGAMF